MLYEKFKNEKTTMTHGVPAGHHKASQTREKKEKKK